jgi:MtN3 and saliva related transmembrane protein
VIGYLAGALTTISFVPQLLLTLRTQNTASLSLGMYSAFTLGVALWLGYGIMMRDYALIIANALTLAMATSILAIKVVSRLSGKEKSSAADDTDTTNAGTDA